ncbi:hypothetical protein AVEN_167368-1, partial [Araneus ventricosus]
MNIPFHLPVRLESDEEFLEGTSFQGRKGGIGRGDESICPALNCYLQMEYEIRDKYVGEVFWNKMEKMAEIGRKRRIKVW